MKSKTPLSLDRKAVTGGKNGKNGKKHVGRSNGPLPRLIELPAAETLPQLARRLNGRTRSPIHKISIPPSSILARVR